MGEQYIIHQLDSNDAYLIGYIAGTETILLEKERIESLKKEKTNKNKDKNN
jgi:hypothetical protein